MRQLLTVLKLKPMQHLHLVHAWRLRLAVDAPLFICTAWLILQVGMAVFKNT